MMQEKVVVPVEATAADVLRERRLRLSPSLRYDLPKIFPRTKGWGWKEPFMQKYHLLKHLEPLLEKCLLPEEKILYIAKGNQQSTIEVLFMGIWASGINHTVFVLTNARLLMFRTNGSGKPKKTYWMIYYSQITKFKGNWHGLLKLKLRDRRSLDFAGFSKPDRKKMPAIFEKALDDFRKTGFHPEVSQSMENLCSHCFDQVPKHCYCCETCGTVFWTPRELAIRSFFFPSWGDFLMGHSWIAVIELFGGIGSWTYLVSGIIELFKTGDPLMLIIPACFLLLFNGLDAAFTYHVASKGLHPKIS